MLLSCHFVKRYPFLGIAPIVAVLPDIYVPLPMTDPILESALFTLIVYCDGPSCDTVIIRGDTPLFPVNVIVAVLEEMVLFALAVTITMSLSVPELGEMVSHDAEDVADQFTLLVTSTGSDPPDC